MYYQDLDMYYAETGRNDVKLEISFPSDYPDSPPFIRLVSRLI